MYKIHQPGITDSNGSSLLSTPQGFMFCTFISFVVILSMYISTAGFSLLSPYGC